MDTTQYVAVMQAYLAGQAVEYRFLDVGSWADLPAAGFNAWNFEEFEYRVKDLPHDEIDWDAVSIGFKWLARDLNGDAHLFTHAPAKRSMDWLKTGGTWTVASNFSSYAPGPRDWKDSLQERPA